MRWMFTCSACISARKALWMNPSLFYWCFSTGHTAVGFHLSSTDTLRRRRLHHSTRGHRRHFLYHQQRPGKVFCSHPAAQIKGGFLRKRFTAWMTEMSKQWRKWLYDGDNLLWCVALITITSFFHYIWQVKVTEKGQEQEEQVVLSKLSERQWFGEKALWG